MSSMPPTEVPPSEMPPSGRRARWPWLVALAVIIVAGVVVLAVALTRDDSPKAAPTTTTASRPTTTTASTTTTTRPSPTTAPAPPDAATAVWPFASSATRYADPVSAAKGFAIDFVGFTAPVAGAFQPGDSRSGEVDVRPRADGPITTVFVRQLGSDDAWWVVGAATANIELEEPAALAAISSPVRLRGRSTAFEATVNTAVRQDGGVEPLGSGFVMGGATGQLEPFDGTLAFSRPTAASGAIVLHTVSSENGQVWEATVVRVNFTPA